MKEKENSVSRQFLFNKIAKIIAKDIDNSCEKKVNEHRLNLSMYNTKETKLNYLNSEKSKITKFLKDSSYNSKRGLNNYLDYLSKDSKDNFLREEAIIFVIRDVFLEDVDEVDDLLNTICNNYIGYNREGPIKIYVDGTILLENNSFLTKEIDKINQEDSKELDPNNNKLKWKGSPTELIELLKALKENGSIEGTQKEIISSFANFLNVELGDPKATLQRLVHRSEKTIFLDKLRLILIKFYIKNDEK
jgi:hypothetical protein